MTTGRGRKRKTVPNVFQRAGGSTPPQRPSTLPSQYNFTPNLSPKVPHIRNYPPPQQLFQNSTNQQAPLAPTRSEEVQQASVVQPLEPDPNHEAPIPNSQAHSHPSSQGNNFQEEIPAVLPELQEDTLRALNATLAVPDRDQFTTVLSPTPKPKTTWFDRDEKSSLVRKITRVFKYKFDGPFYSWTCVPRDRQERYFLEFAKTHHWDPLITGTVQAHFETIIGRRMKDMVSSCRRSREQPKWIRGTLWTEMCTFWDTEEAKKRSQIYSAARMSDRNGLGPHIHFSGPKSFQEIQHELEEELGRPVSIGEVFIKTHTKPDGTYVDRKAERIAKAYEQNVLDRLAELEGDTELTIEEYTTIFLQSTEKDGRGNPYGIGSLKDTLVSGKRKQPGDSSSFQALEAQLKDAQRKIEEQAAYNERRESEVATREAEQARIAAEQKAKLEHLSLVEKYLRPTDPHFLDFMASQSSSAETTEPLSKDP